MTATKLRAHAINDALEDWMIRRWQRWVTHYGSLLGPWVANLEPPRRRMRMLVVTCLAGALESLNPSWSADLDYAADDLTGPPTAVILTNGDDVRILPVAMSGRILKIAGVNHLLTSPHAGQKIVETLASRSADWFGDADGGSR